MADTETNMRQFRFTFDTPQGTYSDAINMTDAEWTATTVAQRRAMAKDRRDTWLAQVKAASKPSTKKELRVERDRIETELVTRRAEIDAQLNDPAVLDG